MKIKEGEWAGWEVWIEYADVEHNPIYTPPPPRNSDRPYQCQGEVFVECEHGKSFKVLVQPPPTNDLQFQVRPTIDGHSIFGFVKVDRLSDRVTLQHKYDQENGVTIEKSLLFSTLERVTNDVSVQQDLIPSLGTIVMSLSTGKTRKGKFATPWHSGSSPTSISEKVKKVRFKLAGEAYRQVTLTSVTAGQTVKKAEPTQLWYLDDDPNAPKCRIVFHYATRDAVQLRLSGNTNNGTTDVSNEALARDRSDPTDNDSDNGITVADQPAEVNRPQVCINLTEDDDATIRGSPVRKSVTANGTSDSDSDSSDSDSSTDSDDDGLGEGGRRSEVTARAVASAKAKAKLKAKLKYKLKIQLKAELKAKAERKAARKAARKGKGMEKEGAQQGSSKDLATVKQELHNNSAA